MSVSCDGCGHEYTHCEWGGCNNSADVVLHISRPCGHYFRVIGSCLPCAWLHCITQNGKAQRSSPCDVCHEVQFVECHVARTEGEREWLNDEAYLAMIQRARDYEEGRK